MKKQVLYSLVFGFIMYLTLGMIDYETESILDLFRRGNLGALVIFTLFFAVLAFLVQNFLPKKSDVNP